MSTCRIPSKRTFQNITLKAAYSILDKRSLLDTPVEAVTKHYSVHTNPRTLIHNWDKTQVSTRVRDIGPILFSGGPPGHTKVHKGSLLTLILDAVFNSRAQEAIRGTNT